MFKSMKSIFILILIILIWYLFFNIFLSKLSDNTTFSNDINIYQLNENYLQITENITIDVNDNDVKVLSFPISLYKDYEEGYINLVDPQITINGQEILNKKEINYNKQTSSNNSNNDIGYSYAANRFSISTKYLSNFSKGKYIITLSYKCNINNFISNYNNTSILKIKRNKDFENLNLTITLPKETSSFKVNSSKAKVENISNNTYKVNLSNVKILDSLEYVCLLFDNDIFQSAKVINEDYSVLKETNIFANEKNNNIIYFFIIAIFTIILFIRTLLITKNVKLKKNYVRDTKSVISPILAETLIDRKMRFKRTYNDMYC